MAGAERRVEASEERALLGVWREASLWEASERRPALLARRQALQIMVKGALRIYGSRFNREY